MDAPGSVTRYANQLRHEDRQVREEAAREIWARYSPRLLTLVRQHLAQRIRQRENEDDVLQSMYKSFFRDQGDGKYPLQSRADVWRLLVRMTLCKVRNAANRHRAGRRDVRREEAAPADQADDWLCSEWILEHLADNPEPDPAEAAQLADGMEWLLRLLPEELRRIVLWRLEGYSNQEIARMIDRTERTVEMKLLRVRRRWQQADLSP